MVIFGLAQTDFCNSQQWEEHGRISGAGRP